MAKSESKSQSKAALIDDCDQFISNLRREMSKNRRAFRQFPKLASILPGLTQILMSIDKVSPVSEVDGFRVEEWNPFSQRPVVDQVTFQSDELIKDFQVVTKIVTDFIQLVHESIHVLTLEVFFTGQLNPSRARDFKAYLLKSEAFAFWYADLVLTPLLRTRLPDAELVYRNSTPSSYFFHPFRAFKAAKVKSPSESLQIYLDSFSGYQSQLDRSGNVFVRNLRKRIHKFYLDSMLPLQLLHESLSDVGLFGEYFDRFCAKQNLPSLFGPSPLTGDLSVDPQGDEHFQWLLVKGFKDVAKRTDVDVLAVRIRRKLQTRAYFGLSLRRILSSGQYISTRSKLPRSEIKLVEKSVSNYLESLEGELAILCEGKKSAAELAGLSRRLSRLDRVYEHLIRGPLERHGVWASRRGFSLKWYTNDIGVKSIGLVGSGRSPTSADVSALASIVFNEFDRGPKNWDDFQQVIRKLHLLSKSTSAEKKRRIYNSILTQRLVLPLWSVPLASVRPSEGQYRELLFQYQ